MIKKTTIAAVALLAFVAKAETCVPTNVVVAPLTDAHWTQGAPYNEYSPLNDKGANWAAGCVAIAAAQELLVWQWPWRFGAVHEASHIVAGSDNATIRFDGTVPFEWDALKGSYSSSDSLASRHAAARLALFCQSLVQMQFVSSGGEAKKGIDGTMEWYEYDDNVVPSSGDAAIERILSDLEFGSPLQVGVNVGGYGGHEVVGVGYGIGTNAIGETVRLLGLNMGWGGSVQWWNLASTSGSYIKSAKVGFRPIKSVQIEPVAPVSGNSVTLNWHLPNCYTNKISGFTVAKKTPYASTTTWTDDFSSGGKGRSSNTNEVIVTNGRLYGWQGTASAIYTYDVVLLLTENSVLSYKYHDDYMAGMSVRVEAKIGDGSWQTISEPAVHNGWNYAGATTETVNLGAYAGKGARFRFVVEYVSGSIWTTGVNAANVWFDDLSVSDVNTFETVATSATLPASARSTTFSNLEEGEVYAFSVTPVMSDGSAAVIQMATTTIGSPAPSPIIGTVTMSPRGTDLMQEGFYTDIAMGWNIIDVTCQNVETLEAFISHQSVLPQSKIEVVNNGGGSFSINIDASEVAAKWAGQRMILTLKATNSTGETTYKDLELRLVASGVPVSFPDVNIWTASSSDWYDTASLWSKDRAPDASDEYVVFSRSGNTDVYITDNVSLNNAAVEGTGNFKFVDFFNGGAQVSIQTLMNEASFTIDSAVADIGEIKPLTAVSSGSVTIASGKSVTIQEGKTWQSRGGFTFGGNQTITVNGSLDGALTAGSTGTTLVLKPTSSLTAASLSFANNTIRIEKTAEASPTVSVTGEANLTGATIEVVPENGMALGDSVALMSAGSFAGVDSATLSGLDGYSLEVDDGTLYAKKIAEVEAPVPVAVWDGDFSPSALTKFSGYELVDWNTIHGGATHTWGATDGVDYSDVTIDKNNQGLMFRSTAAMGAVTVLVKYSGLTTGSLYRRVLFATTSNSNWNYDRCGVQLTTTNTVNGIWNQPNTAAGGAEYPSENAGYGSVLQDGTMAFVYDKSGSGGTFLYNTDSQIFASNPVWSHASLKAGDIYGVSVGGMNEGASADNSEAAKGMTITALAVFTNVLTVAEMNAYVWPSEEPQYEGPDPIAVWVAGEFDDDRSAHGGCEFALNGNTTNSLGQIVIGNSTTLGATIATPGYDNATVLVEYEIPSGGAPAANSVPVSVFVTKEMGALAGSGSFGLGGYWLNGSTVTTGYAFSSPAPSIPQKGYLLISTPANSDSNSGNHYVAAYVGETVSALSGGETSGLRFTAPTNRVTSVGIGGPTVAGAVPWAGMVIKNVAIFDDWLAPADIANYTFPAQGAVRPVDSDRYAIEPVVSWVNDFKTTEKGDYTLSVSGTTAAKDDTFGGTLTIGDAAAVVDVRNGANGGNVTVLVKYRATPATVNAPVVTFGETLSNSVKIDVGAYTQSARTLAVNRSYNGGNNKWMALNTASSLNEGVGYLLCARKSNDMLVYVGDSLDSMTGGSTAAPGDISYSCDLIQAVGIGGPSGLPNADSAWSPFAGFVVEKVVVFNGYYTPDQIRYVESPEDGDTLSIASGETWKFAAGETKTYANIGTLSSGGTIAITNASTLAVGSYKLAEWTTPQIMVSGYGYVDTLKVEGLPSGLSAELVYGAKAIYLRVWNPTDQASKGTIKVWPYGDSITEGFNAGGTRANYRVLLAQKLSMLGFNVEMVGCYDKINGADVIDPAGQVVPDAWKWHSAKHGATAGPTTSAPRRANLCENVDALCAQAGKPDVVLLLAGANDIVPATGLSAAQVVSSITNIVAHLAANLPDSKIVVGNQLNIEAGYTPGNYPHVTNMIPQVNTLLRDYVSNLPSELNGKVFLADLNAYVKSGETGVLYGGDHLHPDWLGHDQMAEGWLSVITNQFTAAQVFPSATVPAAPTAEQLGAAAKDDLAVYRQGFTLARRIDVASNLDAANPYAESGGGATEDIEKVGYFVEYVRADNNAHKWVWVDMDAFGTAIGEIGLPTNNHQQVVTRLHVKSNLCGIDDVAADDDTITGFVEFSPCNYSTPSASGENYPNGNHSDTYDWNDTLSTSGSYGCMQVHRIFTPAKSAADGVARGGQVLFAYNNWHSSSSTAEFGIGNFSSHFYRGANDAQTLDYTFTANAPKMNADAYSVKRIEIWTKTAEPENPDERDLTDDEIAGGKTLTRLNGKVYCGNDANRAVITNYLSQMEGTRPLTPPAPNTVDLLIVFDKPSAEYALGTGVTLEEFAARNVAKMNYILTRTDIDTNVWFRLAGVYPIEATAASHTDAMGKGQESSAPGWEMVHAARERVGADVVISLYHGAEGMAYRCTPGGIKNGSEAAWAFCGVGHSDIDATRGWTWVHEVAHTASLYHNIAGAAGNNDPYYVGCGFGASIGGKWCSTVMNYEPTEDAFSSANHKLNGEIYSITNGAGAYLDASGVLAELLPYMANYRATVVPEGVVVKAVPQDESIVASGATMTLSCNDPEATIYYYNASLGETEANAAEYSAPVAITPGNPQLGMAQYYVFAKKNGEKVTAADAIIDYKVAGSMLVPDNPADILDMSGLSWSVGDGWTKTTEQSCKGGSAYVCAPSAAATCSLKTTITVDTGKTLVFHHIDNFTEGASFVVWVDDMPMWYKKGANSTGGKWVEDSVFLGQGSHAIEFAFSGNGSTLYLDYLSIDRFTTTTGFPVPYLWIEACFPGIVGQPDAMYETMAKSAGNNGYSYWESYVLGLEPTNALSKFIATIRMDGTTPVVGYSPTNEVLKASGAIEYVLQGKPALSNDWQNVEFDEPGDTNRFFRVKVTW